MKEHVAIVFENPEMIVVAEASIVNLLAEPKIIPGHGKVIHKLKCGAVEAADYIEGATTWLR